MREINHQNKARRRLGQLASRSATDGLRQKEQVEQRCLRKQREIKFRAWDKNLEIMIDPEYLSLDGNGLQSVFYDNCDTEESAWENDIRDIELMQYTGLKDKNSVEVYGGDIVTDGINPPFAVTWDYTLLARLTEIDIEVIGNVCENPEILGGKL